MCTYGLLTRVGCSRVGSLKPRCKPLFMCSGHMLRHCTYLLRYNSVIIGHEINLTPDIEMLGVTSVTGFRWTL
jgi:hypothetical protein